MVRSHNCNLQAWHCGCKCDQELSTAGWKATLAWLVCWALHRCALPQPYVSLQMLCSARMWCSHRWDRPVVCVSKETDACSALGNCMRLSKANL